MMKEPGLKEVDTVLAGLSLNVKKRIEDTSHPWLSSIHSYYKDGQLQFSFDNESDHAEKIITADEVPWQQQRQLPDSGASVAT
jgi:hypothetical protein